MKSTVVDESLYSFKPMYYSREYQASTRFIWQVELVEHFIWKVDLILWLFQMGSNWRHRWGNSWSGVTGSFAWGVYLNLNSSSENINSYLMSMCTSSCSLHLTTMGGISDSLSGHFIWKYELTLEFTLASQRSFYERPTGHVEHIVLILSFCINISMVVAYHDTHNLYLL